MAFDKLQEEQGIPLDDFLRELHKTPYEYIGGEKLVRVPSLAGHSSYVHQIFSILDKYCVQHHLGECFMNGTFIEEAKKDWVKGSFTPDLLFYKADKFQDYIKNEADWEEKPFMLVPDLVIEVVSKNDSYSDINRKVMEYLRLGVKAIWVIDPHAQNAYVHTAKKTQMLGKEDSISGDDILPKFQLSLSALFDKEKA